MSTVLLVFVRATLLACQIKHVLLQTNRLAMSINSRGISMQCTDCTCMRNGTCFKTRQPGSRLSCNHYQVALCYILRRCKLCHLQSALQACSQQSCHVRKLQFDMANVRCGCVQIVMTANAFVWSFICMPHTPQDDAAAKRVMHTNIQVSLCDVFHPV